MKPQISFGYMGNHWYVDDDSHSSLKEVVDVGKKAKKKCEKKEKEVE